MKKYFKYFKYFFLKYQVDVMLVGNCYAAAETEK
jgi:hypothetical protein